MLYLWSSQKYIGGAKMTGCLAFRSSIHKNDKAKTIEASWQIEAKYLFSKICEAKCDLFRFDLRCNFDFVTSTGQVEKSPDQSKFRNRSYKLRTLSPCLYLNLSNITGARYFFTQL